jgi:hypothetical protein
MFYVLSRLLLSLGLAATIMFAWPEQEPADEIAMARQGSVAQIAQQYGIDKAEILAIPYPEFKRFNLLSNLAETKSLEVLYAWKGREGADFSIGNAQMKPSFAEDIEQSLVDLNLQKSFSNLLDIRRLPIMIQRRKRIERLNDPYFQSLYVAAFIQVMDLKFNWLPYASPNERIRFLAAAYNYGFHRSEAGICAWMEVKAFPFGRQYPEQDKYADVALAFYLQNQ